MEVDFLLTYPLYALALKDGTGTISLEAGARRFLPLFTDVDAVESYLDEAAIEDCDIEVLETAPLLRDFLANLATPADGIGIEWVVLDPLADGSGVFTLVTLEQILRTLPV